MSSDRKLPQKFFNCLAVASPSFCKDQSLLEESKKLCKNLVTNQTNQHMTESQLIDFLRENQADAVIIGTDFLTAKVLDAVPNLKAVGKYGVGLDRVDLAAIKQKGIYFGYQAGVNKRSVSELALCFMLGHQRNIFKSISRMEQNHWIKDGGLQLSNSTVGIVGMGHIGSDLAGLLMAFHCKLLVCDILDKTKEAKTFRATQVSYEELLGDSDIITFHVPGGTSTHHMFGLNEVKRTKATALIINTARGSVVDFDATSQAVRDGCLAGYASDVFPSEPFLAENYKLTDGFYFTPHIGGNAREAVLAMGRSAIEGLRSYLEQDS
jgi:phosphoglycerate dehydrogenase-like enzyme